MSVIKNKMLSPANNDVKAGEFSKLEAANFIIQGYQHVHSSPFGMRDPLIATTHRLSQTPDTEPYIWERMHTTSFIVQNSSDRQKVIEQIIQSPELTQKRFLKDRIRVVLEEMCTNAIYHAYRNQSGVEKYQRTKKIELKTEEAVTVRYGFSPNGIYLNVEDKGANLSFPDVQKAFQRCYGEPKAQIETKESGAGLGLYMIFETLTHLKIEVCTGKFCRISGWLSDVKNYNPKLFSLNFFEWR